MTPTLISSAAVTDDPAWRPNAENSRVWFGADGLFLLWPNAAADLTRLLEDDQLRGIPQAPGTLLEVLAAAGTIEPREPGEIITWAVQPPQSKTPVDAIKLSVPESILTDPGGRTPPLTARLAVNLTQTAATPTSASPPLQPTPEQNAPQVQLALAIDPPGDQTDVIESAAGEPAPDPVARVTQGTAPPPGAPPPPAFKLVAPLRLHLAVREALSAVIETLNGDGGEPAACTVSSGVFVPLGEIQRRGVDPSAALRALAEAGMLAGAKGTRAPTVTRDFGGEQKVGCVLSPRFIAGLDPADFDCSIASG